MVVNVQRKLCVIKIENVTPKWWSPLASGRYSEEVVNSGLTVFFIIKAYMAGKKYVWGAMNPTERCFNMLMIEEIS